MRFAINEMFRQSASKFAISYETPCCCCFSIFITTCNYNFPLGFIKKWHFLIILLSTNISFLKSDMVVHILTEFLMSCLKRQRLQSNVFDRRAWSSTHYNADDKLVQRPISYKSNQYSLKSYESFPFKTILYNQGRPLGLKSTSVTLGLGSETRLKNVPWFLGWGKKTTNAMARWH